MRGCCNAMVPYMLVVLLGEDNERFSTLFTMNNAQKPFLSIKSNEDMVKRRKELRVNHGRSEHWRSFSLISIEQEPVRK